MIYELRIYRCVPMRLPALLARAARVTASFASSKRFAPPYNLIISNVPGPAIPIYIAGVNEYISPVPPAATIAEI